MATFMKSFNRKLKLGRVAMPLWALALAGTAVVAVAGQAVGPVLSGSVSGNAGLTVEQSILLSDSAGTFTIADTAAGHTDDYLGVINDDGTSFTAAVELHVGDTVKLSLPLRNVSDANGNAILEISCPAGVDIEVDSSGLGTIKEAQMSKNNWLLRVNAATTDTLDIILSPKDDLKPGFYTISGRISQITG